MEDTGQMDALNTLLASSGRPPFVFFGPRANCTLALCKPEWSVYGYRPSLAANLALLCAFLAALVVHVVLGVRWRAWSYMACMVAGCLDEMLGYAGRVWMFYDLWNFDAFMIQVVCITTAPVFFCAAIYVVLAKSITTFAPALSRFSPAWLYWVFIPCDLVSLVLQGAGGALSALSSGDSPTGDDIAIAGLAVQVVTLVCFCAVYAEFLVRYYRAGRPPLPQQQQQQPQADAAVLRGAATTTTGLWARARTMTLGARLKLFYAFETLAIVLILARCAFRVAELQDGYGGHLIKREDLFIGLEGVLVVLAAFALCVGHPGLIFNAAQMRRSSVKSSDGNGGHAEK